MRIVPLLVLAATAAGATSTAQVEPSELDGGTLSTSDGNEASPEFRPPALLADSPAIYPPTLEGSHVSGTVELELTVDGAGEVSRAEVVGSIHPLLDESALHAATRLRFKPAEQSGHPIAARVRFLYTFEAAKPRLPTGRLTGRVRQKGSRRPLALATLRLDGKVAGQTLVDGRFVISVPPGEHQLEVSAAGHHTAHFTERVSNGEAMAVDYWLEPFEAHPYETVVHGEREREEVSRVSLREAELREVPGTMGDPFRAVMLLPGVGSLLSGVSYPVVRGSQPAATGYFLDGIRVPVLFHLFLGPAVVHPDFLEGLDFYPGAPPTPYGRLLAGAVEGHLTRPREQDLHGSVYFDLLNSGAFLEYGIPSTGTQISIAGRYSYSALLLGLLNLAGTRPSLGFADYQGRIEQKVGRGTLRLFAFGSFDHVGAEIPGGDAFLQTINFHRIDLRYQLPVGNGVFELAGTAGWDEIGASGTIDTAGEVAVGLVDRTLGIRSSFTQFLIPTLELRVGGDFQHRASELSGSSDVGQVVGPQAALVTSPVANGYFTDIFAELLWRPDSRWLLAPGLRFDTYNLIPGVHLPALEPRLTLRWNVAPTVTLKAGAGLYHMAPATLITLPVQDVAGLRLGLQEGIQTDVGAEWRPIPALEIVTDAYFNPLPRVVELDPATALLNAVGGTVGNPATRGRSYGVEVMVRHPLGGRWFGWISYSFNRSERLTLFNRFNDYGDLVGTSRAYLPYAFEQQHIFNAVVSYQIGRGWTVGAALHFNTGRPETGVFTSRSQRPGLLRDDSGLGIEQSTWVIQDLDRAGRLAPFFRADVRVAKTWVLDTFTLEAYLDFQNVAFRSEVISYSYAAETGVAGTQLFRQPVSITIPLPILGMKARF